MDPDTSNLQFWDLDFSHEPIIHNIFPYADFGSSWPMRPLKTWPETVERPGADSPTNLLDFWFLIIWKTAFMWEQVYNWETCIYSMLDKCLRKLGERISSWVEQQLHHELWLGCRTGPSGQSRTTCRQIFFPTNCSLTLKWSKDFLFCFFFLPLFTCVKKQQLITKVINLWLNLEPLEGHINASLAFHGRRTPGFSHLKTEVWTEREVRRGGWLAESAPMGAGSDPVWPRFGLAVTFDLSGPGSPPALLPGFRNAPPWGPERANQDEEEPQRAVGDWRRGEEYKQIRDV